MFLDSLHQAIIGIYTLMITFQSLPPLVSCNPQRYTILLTQLLQLGPAYSVSAMKDS